LANACYSQGPPWGRHRPNLGSADNCLDGDYVFAHTEYDFATRRIGFEVFRFEGDLAVEHWDNIQQRQGPNPSGHTMVDGSTEVTDLDRTEAIRHRPSNIVIYRDWPQLGTAACSHL
jgi:hypothetical protein